MKKRLFDFVFNNNINLFSDSRPSIKPMEESIFKTKDARLVHNKVMSRISSNFVFGPTNALWSCFGFTSSVGEIIFRQEYFRSIKKRDGSFLKKLVKPIRNWKPRYGIIAVTEDESTFIRLREIGCVAQLLVSENDVLELEKYDIVQVVNTDNFSILLERIPQSVFLDSIEDVYLERYLEILSGWRENFRVLRAGEVSFEVGEIMKELENLFNLMDEKEGDIISEERAEAVLEKINDKISVKVREMTISGDSLLKMLGEGKMPQGILEIVKDAVTESGLSEHIFNMQLPVTIDYKELDEQIKRQSANEYTNMAERVKREASRLKKIPSLLKKLSCLLVIEDFEIGIFNYLSDKRFFPSYSDNFHFSDAKNIFLNDPQGISFQLDEFNRCSILTGANSGGKTTLLEHILQNVSLFQIGLPVYGEVHMPLFTEVYYFAKNQGSASKGAFETLLSQMAHIRPGTKTLILADEIEAVTEPGIAGKIISATADFFIKKRCFLVLATHLGYEIQKNLPDKARIDGIEAKGLDKDFNLIVDHNPVLGRLAHSTPELIVERLANSTKEEYFKFLYEKIKEVSLP